MLFIPGLMSDGAVWNDVIDTLPDEISLHIATIPGFAGKPPASLDGAVIQRSTQAITAYLEDNALENVILVGHSIGGQMILKVALAAPSRIDGLVVVDSLPFLSALYTPNISINQAKAQSQMIKVQLIGMSDDMFRAQQQATVPIMSKTAAFHPKLMAWSMASDRATVAAATAEALGSDWRADLAGITTPTQVLAAYDKAMPLDRDALRSLYEDQYKALEDVHIRMVDNSFHFIPIDQPQAITDALVTVLESHQ
ncbi:alpha/beta hydrolase [Iodidimonas muriae]|uniref:Alpha/beta hydrolase n=1 Tax=Iodidimonas muriae TaxID=261467 RepID=A0ABQ2L9Y0_9PROT|nr:alpha/beta hydrolase [Iodidimonas muriae]